MSDSPDYDPVLLAWVTPIVTALADVVPAEQLMLVGAQCRDLLHWRFCRGVPPRATNDTDIAGTLNNWDHFEAIRATFRALGSTGHRFLIADRAVDALPFGEVESPTGTTRHPPGNQLMNVHGCTDAYLRADVLPLPGGLTVHLPQPPSAGLGGDGHGGSCRHRRVPDRCQCGGRRPDKRAVGRCWR